MFGQPKTKGQWHLRPKTSFSNGVNRKLRHAVGSAALKEYCLCRFDHQPVTPCVSFLMRIAFWVQETDNASQITSRGGVLPFASETAISGMIRETWRRCAETRNGRIYAARPQDARSGRRRRYSGGGATRDRSAGIGG